MTRSREDLRRLHFINALFAHVTGQDLYLAEQIKEAITFSLTELEQQVAAHPEAAAKYDANFNNAAAALLANAFDHLPAHGFYHWDAARNLETATPLFARDEIMELRKAGTNHPIRLSYSSLRSKASAKERVHEFQKKLISFPAILPDFHIQKHRIL